MLRLGGNLHLRVLGRFLALALIPSSAGHYATAQNRTARFHVVALAEHGGIHKPFVDAAKIWLGKLASENDFTIDYGPTGRKAIREFLDRAGQQGLIPEKVKVEFVE